MTGTPESGAIDVRDVTRTFSAPGGAAGAVTALDAVSLALASGQVVALTGPSGSGKTTLLNCIAALDRPDAGSVSVFGVDVGALSYEAAVAWRRGHLAMAFQGHRLVEHLTAVENIDAVLRLRGVGRVERRERAAAWLDALDIGDLADRQAAHLSGGQRQRVGLARALACEAEVFIADEPTGALDADTGARVIEVLTGVAARSGTTVLLATHDPTVAAAADRVVSLSDGRLDR